MLKSRRCRPGCGARGHFEVAGGEKSGAAQLACGIARESSSFGAFSLAGTAIRSNSNCEPERERGARARERCADARRGARGDYANERPIC